MPRKIRTRNKMNKRNKKRSLKKMKGGSDSSGQYYFIYSHNPTFSRYNGLLVVGAGDTYNFHSGGEEISNLQKNDWTTYNKCCLKCINDFSDQNEIIRHLGSYCHTCDVPISWFIISIIWDS